MLDGAMGTMIQRYKLSEADFRGERFADHPIDVRGNNDLLSLTRPDVVREIHKAYLEAGADLIETNTFNATSIAQKDYGLEHAVYDINLEAAKIAKDICAQFSTDEKPRFVVGALGPTPKTASISPDVNDPGARNVTFDELVASYGEQVRGLLDGGVDLLIVETIFDTLNAKAALFAIDAEFERRGARVPLMISGTVTDASGRILSGQTVEAFWNSVRHAKPLTVGLNCALGAALMRPYIEELATLADTFISVYPNAGLPNPMCETGFDETADVTSSLLKEFAEAGFVNIAGGCCGTTPDHIRATALALEGLTPRAVPTVQPVMRLSGLEPVTIDEESLFVNVGERTNVTGSKAFARLDFERAIRRRGHRRAAAGRKRRADHRRQHGRSDARLGRGDDAVLEADRLRARYRARAGDDRQLKMERDRSRVEMRAGQMHRQLDFDEGRRGVISSSRPSSRGATAQQSS